MEQQQDPWRQAPAPHQYGTTIVAQQQQQGPDETHLKVIGALFIVWGALVLLAGLVLLLAAAYGGAVGESQSGQEGVFAIAAGAGMLVFAVLLVVGLPALLAGIGILQRREWGRILGIIVAGISLLNFPFGTAFGIYALVILTQFSFNQQQQQVVRLG